MNLREVSDNKLQILNEAKDGTVRVKAVFMKAEMVNLNKRLYPEAILQREVNKLQGKIEKHGVLSASGHPAGMHPDVDQVSHKIDKVTYDPQTKEASMELTIIPTRKGKDVLHILKAGGALGLSSRGTGSTKTKEGVDVIGDDYSLEGVDIVTTPSFGTRFSTSNIIESVSFAEQKKQEEAVSKVTGLTEKQYEQYKIDKSLYGFKGTMEDWKRGKK